MTPSATHWWQMATSADTMLRTIALALLPGVCVSTWFLGPGLLQNLLVSTLAGYLLESLARLLRGHALRSGFADPGVPMTAILLTLLLPIDVPFWLPIAGMAFATLLVRQVFGGTGKTLFHPAMSAYLFILLMFPDSFTRSVTAAEQTLQAHLWINSSFLLGGLFLRQQRIIRWHIPGSLLTTLVLVSWIVSGLGMSVTSLLLAPLSGFTMLAAFFIATDYGNAAITPRGRVLYGALIGTLLATLPIGATSVAVTIVVANFCAPLFDQLGRPRIYGHATDRVSEEAR